METSEQLQENKMGVMPVNKLLISMSLPIMASMLIQALYNIVDSAFVAKLSENALTAVSLAFPIQNLMIATGVGIGVGMNALLSRFLGEKDSKNANKTAIQGILLAIACYILFLLVGIFGARAFFESQTTDLEIINYGTIYISICCIGSFGIFGQLILERLLQSTGRTFYTMITQGTGAIINIILDPILIFGLIGFPKMGIAGAALATIIGQIVGALLGVYFNIKKNDEISLHLKEFKPDLHMIGKILAVGIPSIIMSSIGSVMIFGMNQILMKFSSTATAVFGIYFKLQSFVFMPIFGLTNGMIPIMAYNLGAKKKDRMKETIKLSVIYAVSIMLLGLAIIQIFPKQLLGIFNASDLMVEIGVPALRIISLSFIFAGFGIVSSATFQALGNGVLSMCVSIARQLLVLLPVAYFLSKLNTVSVVWWAFPIAEIVAVFLSITFLKYMNDKVIHNI